MSTIAVTITEEQRVGAVHRLAFAREQHPELSRRLAEAKVELAAAIIAMDEAADIPGRHNLHEQAAVETMTQRYAQALADLVRGDV